MTDRTCTQTSRIPFVRQLEHQLVSAYRKSMPHPKGYLACIIDLIGDQPIVCQHST